MAPRLRQRPVQDPLASALLVEADALHRGLAGRVLLRPAHRVAPAVDARHRHMETRVVHRGAGGQGDRAVVADGEQAALGGDPTGAQAAGDERLLAGDDHARSDRCQLLGLGLPLGERCRPRRWRLARSSRPPPSMSMRAAGHVHERPGRRLHHEGHVMVACVGHGRSCLPCAEARRADPALVVRSLRALDAAPGAARAAGAGRRRAAAGGATGIGRRVVPAARDQSQEWERRPVFSIASEAACARPCEKRARNARVEFCGLARLAVPSVSDRGAAGVKPRTERQRPR